MILYTSHASVPLRVLAASAVAAATVAGCSAGQQAQTAIQEPAVNGTRAEIGNIEILDVRVRAEQTSDAVRPGESVDLLFVATNQSPDTADKLVEITSDIGSVDISGDTDVETLSSLLVGTPDGPDASELMDALPANQARAEISLSEPISSGLLYDFTFTFEKAGDTTVSVPVAAGLDAPRQHHGSYSGGGH